ncbi:MAG: carboxypeptidase regulatory-like domain-containing protein [Nocardioides sp.]
MPTFGLLSSWILVPARWAAAVVIALIASLCGILPAQAAGVGTISATLSAPGGGAFTSLAAMHVEQFNPAWEEWSEVAYETSSDGTFEATVEAGSYRVCFWAEDYPYLCYNGRTNGEWDDVDVVEGQTTTIEQTLVEYGDISGVVTDGSGPVAHVRVQAYVESVGAPEEWGPEHSTWTEADGSYSFGQLRPGTYRLRFSAPGLRTEFYEDASAVWRATDIEVGSGLTVADVDAQLAQLPGISGHIDLPDGAVDAQPRVRAIDEQGEIAGSARVDANGDYQILGLDDGSYRVSIDRVSGYSLTAAQFYQDVAEGAGVDAGHVVEVVGGQQTLGVDDALRIGGELHGVLQNSQGVGLAWCQVQAYTEDGALVTRSGETDQDGAFTIPGLSTGSYLVRVVSYHRGNCRAGWQFYAGNPTLDGRDEAATGVSVTLGESTDLGNLTYVEGGSISGTVERPEGSGPWLDSMVVLRDATTGEFIDGARLNRSGGYRFVGLAAGSYRVTFNRVSGEAFAAAEFFDDVAEHVGPTSALAVTLGNNEQRTGIDATLAAGGAVSGRVIGTDGQPLFRCRVQATGPNLVTRSAEIARDGSFTVGGLTSADYKIALQPGYDGCRITPAYYASGADILASDPSAATPISAQLGDQLDLGELTYDVQAQISGQVTLPDGAGRYDRRFVVRDIATEQVVSVGRLSSSGSYRVMGLSAGSYRVTFNRISGFAFAAAQFYDGVAEEEGLGAATSVDLAEDESRTGVDAALVAGGSIKGVLRNAAGQGLGYCQVQAFTPDGHLVTRAAMTDAHGGFTIGGLTSGNYLVRVMPLYYSNCLGGEQLYDGGAAELTPDLAEATAVSVTVGEPTAIGTLVYRKGGSISGSVRLPFGATYYDRTVTAIDPATGEVKGRSYADATGAYLIRGLAPGSYRVEFARSSGPAVSAAEYYNDIAEGAGPAGATLVTVGWGERVDDIDARLRLGGSLAGRLVDTRGRALECEIELVTLDDSLTRRMMWAQTGRFNVGGLSTGQYLIRVADNGAKCHKGDHYWAGGDGTMVTDPAKAVVINAVAGVDARLSVPMVYGSKAQPRPVTNVVLPSVSGAPVVGGVLTANPGTWDPADVTVSYQWLRAGTAIPGATASTYRPVAADLGAWISVRVSAAKTGMITAEATSSAKRILPGTLRLVTRPKVSGKPRVGKVLTCKVGAVSPAATQTLVQWLRNGKKIRGATGLKYKIRKSDVGDRLSCQVTYRRPGYTNLVATSASVKVRR